MSNKQTQFNITGMSCEACRTRVEKTVSKLPKVQSCAVNLLTNSMVVIGDVKEEDVIKAVLDIGYGASVKKDNILEDKETPIIKKRFFASIIFLIILMYISMGHNMLSLPLPKILDNQVYLAVLQMVLSLIIIIINKKFYISGFRSVIGGDPNMDTLVSLGSLSSFLWSAYVLFLMSGEYMQNIPFTRNYLHELYFDSSGMILVLITVGKLLESKSRGKTTDALKSLIELSPKTANVIADNIEKTILIDNVKVNDIFLVKPGEKIPVDGKIIDGFTTIDESSLTGESVPVDKKIGDMVSQATINKTGFIKCVALKIGDDTTFNKIINTVSNLQSTKAPIAKVADKVSGIFVPIVILISFITFIVWFILKYPISYSLERAISVLVISCPCSLGLATPVAIMVGSGVGAKNGILFKDAVSLENLSKINIVAFDKTGTITKGMMQVTDIITYNNTSEKELLSVAYSIEKKSEHPISNAIIKKAKLIDVNEYDVKDFSILEGSGLKAKIDNDEYNVGSLKYIEKIISINSDIKEKINNFSDEGKTPVLFVKNNALIGLIEVSDTIKEDSVYMIQKLKSFGINTLMLTGDNNRSAKFIAKKVGINDVISEVSPKDKEEVIRQLKNIGKVSMVGDGINDTIALTLSDIGIAIGKGIDVAIDSSDVVLVNDKLSDLIASIRLSRFTIKNIYENLFFAFIYNIIGIPIAAGVYTDVIKISPMFCALFMSLSSFFVVSNALRLNICDIYSDKKDKKIKNEIGHDEFSTYIKNIDIKEINDMTKTIKVDGMMCEHCEMHVKKALMAIDGVKDAKASHKKGEAIVTLTKDVDDKILKKAIIDAGYNA